jgi:hypothetical protein
MATAKKEKKGKCLGRCGASSGHTTKLKRSILFRYLCIWPTDFLSLFDHTSEIELGGFITLARG